MTEQKEPSYIYEGIGEFSDLIAISDTPKETWTFGTEIKMVKKEKTPREEAPGETESYTDV